MNPVKITETVLRDSHQSLIATRMTIDEILPSLELLDKVGYHAMEVWGGATFDACLRFLNEDPWERLRKIRAGAPNTKLQMLFRGQNILGYRHYADDVVEYFVQKSLANGIDIIRIFDALNDPRNLDTAVKATIKEGGHVQAAFSYTISPVHNTQSFVDFAKNMEHMPYGRFSLPDGKISSRRGKQAVLVDLMEYVHDKAKEVIKDRKFEIEDPENVAQKIVRAVLNYSVLKVERIKDCVFDPELAFSFEGETAPYMLYTFTRLESILRKYDEANVVADYSTFNQEAFDIIKAINDFTNTLKISFEKRDTSLIGKRVMELCKMFNRFYVSTKVLDGCKETTKAKINLVRALRDTLSVGFNLLCIDTLKEM